MAFEDVCVSCKEALVIEITESDDDEDVDMAASSGRLASATRTVPDDLKLGCGCHWHWACLLENIRSSQCPSCASELITQAEAGPQIICSLHNEGGIQEGLDLMLSLTEEAYCNAHPGERKPRAFLEFCRNGDLPAIIEMLQNDDDDDEESPTMSSSDILRYQDPLGKKQSGLHAAVEGKSREVVWLLLLLASKLDLQSFPAAVFQEAGALDVMRDDDDVEAKADIRTFVDAEGRTAEQLATEVGPPFHDWLGQRLLSV